MSQQHIYIFILLLWQIQTMNDTATNILIQLVIENSHQCLLFSICVLVILEERGYIALKNSSDTWGYPPPPPLFLKHFVARITRKSFIILEFRKYSSGFIDELLQGIRKIFWILVQVQYLKPICLYFLCLKLTK